MKERQMKQAWFVCLFLLCGCLPDDSAGREIVFETARIEIERRNLPPLPLNVELAKSPAQRERGLMFRTEMADDAGMLFLFETPRKIGMWMADTPMSLDMFFIDASGVIRYIAEYTEPFSRDVITTDGKMTSVLEMKAGSARRFDISEGDIVRHPVFNIEK